MTTESWSKTRVAAVYDAAADTYNRVGPSFFSYFGRQLAETAQISGNARVLDVATGSGTALVSAAALVGDGGLLVGLDLSPKMAVRAADEIERSASTNCAVVVGDAETLPFSDAQFDRVLCSFAIFLLPDLHGLFGESYRVLRPAGKIALAYSASPDTTWEWYEQLLAEYKPAVRLRTERHDPSSVERLLTSSGFVNVSTQRAVCRLTFTGASQFWAWSWSHGDRAVLESITGDRTDFERRVSEEIHSRARHGELEYRVFGAMTVGSKY